MKPEPLKGKIFHNKNDGLFDKFFVTDVKSAFEYAKKNGGVHWQCNRCKNMYPRFQKEIKPEICSCGNDMISNSTKRKIIFDQSLDEAFEDVTKEVVDVSPQDYKEQLKDIGEEAIKEDVEAKSDLKRKYGDN